jgi:hypothetical protein
VRLDAPTKASCAQAIAESWSRKGSGGSGWRLRSDDLHCVGELYTENDFRELVVAPSLGGLSEFLASVDTARYGLRKQTPEPVFGIIKSVMGFRQCEWSLVTMAWNIKRMHALSLG